MTPPNNTKELRAFIGIVNYYRDMWARRSHLLHPLTALTPNKENFKWTGVEQKSFDDIKHAVVHNTLLAYPDFNIRCDIHMDDIDYQLVAFISHYGKSIAFYIRKLKEPQTQYTLKEREFLSILETLK